MSPAARADRAREKAGGRGSGSGARRRDAHVGHAGGALASPPTRASSGPRRSAPKQRAKRSSRCCARLVSARASSPRSSTRRRRAASALAQGRSRTARTVTGATCASCPPSRSTRPPRATSTTRFRPNLATDRTAAVARVGSTSRRRRPRPARLGHRPGGAPARHQRVRAGRRRADASARALERRLLARARRRAPGGHDRAGAARRPGRVRELLSLG